MKILKKSFVTVLALVMCLCLFTACQNNSDNQTSDKNLSTEDDTDLKLPEKVNIAALKGPTAMGMVKLMQDNEDGLTELAYEFKIGTTDEMVPKISRGEVDMAAIPANLAAVLYQNTEQSIQVLAINTLGVLYVVEKGETIQSVADLKGRTIMSTGKGSTPEFSLNYVLSQNNLNPASDVNVEYKSESAEIIPLLVQSEDGIAILPQPFVANALNKVGGLRIALDWTAEWDKVSQDGSTLVTGVLVVNKAFAERYPDAVAVFAREYAASTAYAQTNLEATGDLVGKYGIVEAAIAKQALPYTKITYIDGADMQSKLSSYLKVLFEQNPQSVGGELPDEGFYYIP